MGMKFVVGCMHSKMEQDERDKVMEEFRSGSSRLLVTTDLLARGIDIYQVGLIINFDLPTRKEQYIHRIGRSGRYGRRGLAINLITKQEGQMLLVLEQFYSIAPILTIYQMIYLRLESKNLIFFV